MAPGPCSATDCCDFMAHIIRSRHTASAVIVVLMLSSLKMDSLDYGFPDKLITQNLQLIESLGFTS